jgi:hypothetical protein
VRRKAATVGDGGGTRCRVRVEASFPVWRIEV